MSSMYNTLFNVKDIPKDLRKYFNEIEVECQAPWIRVVESTMKIERSDTYNGKQVKQDKNFSHKRLQMLVKAGREAGLPHDNTVIPKKTIGWKPACECSNYKQYPLRVCYSMHECTICEKTIKNGELYYDGGIRKRAHKKCAAPLSIPCTVLDPFFGSGTSGIVAHKHGRKFIGIELSKAYLDDIAIPRIEKATEQMKLF